MGWHLSVGRQHVSTDVAFGVSHRPTWYVGVSALMDGPRLLARPIILPHRSWHLVNYSVRGHELPFTGFCVLPVASRVRVFWQLAATRGQMDCVCGLCLTQQLHELDETHVWGRHCGSLIHGKWTAVTTRRFLRQKLEDWVGLTDTWRIFSHESMLVFCVFTLDRYPIGKPPLKTAGKVFNNCLFRMSVLLCPQWHQQTSNS